MFHKYLFNSQWVSQWLLTFFLFQISEMPNEDNKTRFWKVQQQWPLKIIQYVIGIYHSLCFDYLNILIVFNFYFEAFVHEMYFRQNESHINENNDYHDFDVVCCYLCVLKHIILYEIKKPNINIEKTSIWYWRTSK